MVNFWSCSAVTRHQQSLLLRKTSISQSHRLVMVYFPVIIVSAFLKLTEYLNDWSSSLCLVRYQMWELWLEQ